MRTLFLQAQLTDIPKVVGLRHQKAVWLPIVPTALASFPGRFDHSNPYIESTTVLSVNNRR